MSLNQTLVQYLKRIRRYMSFFEWPEKQIKELTVLRYLLESMCKDGNQRYHSPHPSQQLCPDCIAYTEAGDVVGIEVTELVSKTAIWENQKGNEIYRDWQPAEVIARIGERLQAKDAKQFHGGPYARRITIIFTDEITIQYEAYRDALMQHQFQNLPQTDEAYFLFSYNGEDRCPYVRLKIAKD